MQIDLTRLEKLKRTGIKIQARCPACASVGNDRSGNHFFLNESTGQFGCAALPGDNEHRREISRLVGIKDGEPLPEEKRREFAAQRAEERKAELHRQELREAVKTNRGAIAARWEWNAADLWDSSPKRIDSERVEFDSRHFLASLFPQDALVWTGEVFHSGTAHRNHWQTVANWQNLQPGPMTSPAIWKAGAVSRTAENVVAVPYMILDFDEMPDGRKPETPEELSRHLHESLAITRWLREEMRWSLAAIIYTGGKSIHAWFTNPGKPAVESLRIAAKPLGIDAGLLGRPEHPCRLPGQIHSKTGKMSRVLWLR